MLGDDTRSKRLFRIKPILHAEHRGVEELRFLAMLKPGAARPGKGNAIMQSQVIRERALMVIASSADKFFH